MRARCTSERRGERNDGVSKVFPDLPKMHVFSATGRAPASTLFRVFWRIARRALYLNPQT
jgi:hypothetical protein